MGALTRMSVRRIVGSRLKAAGLKTSRKISAHSLRHTTPDLALRGGASLTAVQAMMGHKNINTTMIYVHAIDRVKNAAEKCVSF